MKLSKSSACRVGLYFWREWVKPLFIAAAIVLPFKSAIADWNWVPSGSMKPTILEGDLVLVNKLAFDLKIPFTLRRIAAWSDPMRDDVVVFFSPHDGQRLVKRVVGVPGDRIELRNGILFRNGVAMTYEPVPVARFKREIYEVATPLIDRERSDSGSHLVLSLPNRAGMRDFAEMTVPEGSYFMMGDSRDNSFDSRFYGVVERKQIVGKAGRVVLSFDKNHSYQPRWGRTLAEFER